MSNNRSQKTFNENDLHNIQSIEVIKGKKNKAKQEIEALIRNEKALLSITHFQEVSEDIMKMSDNDILSLIEKTL
jgi:hypothetical protein